MMEGAALCSSGWVLSVAKADINGGGLFVVEQRCRSKEKWLAYFSRYEVLESILRKDSMILRVYEVDIKISTVLLLIGFLSLYDPPTMMLGILFLTLLSIPYISAKLLRNQINGTPPYLALQLLLHHKRLRDIEPPFDRRALIDSIQPLIQQLEGLHINPRPFRPIDPREIRDIGNRHAVSDDPRAFFVAASCCFLGQLLRQPIFEHLIEPSSLGLVALDAIFDLLGRVAVEMVRLALCRRSVNTFCCDPQPPKGAFEELLACLHGAEAALHPDQPFDHFPVLVGIVGVVQLVLRVVSLTEVEHEGTGFEDALFPRLAIGCRGLVDDGRDASVGVDAEEPAFFLHVLADLDVLGLVM